MIKKIKVGIGFATGRKNFQRILRNHVFNWKESGLVEDKTISLNLFVAYDLKYKNTKKTDYTKINTDISDLIQSKNFLGESEATEAREFLIGNGIINAEEASLLFGKGYASQRNLIMYYAIKNKIDYLLFFDDDEYPIAVTKHTKTALWGGQHVLETHLQNIKNADITYGYHCGYISPIPIVEFSDSLTEDDFHMFIKSISNDIINWDNIIKIANSGGVSYADTKVLTDNSVMEVEESNHAKFISGSNLCINLTDPKRVFPFYNPPGARGEDTFLSTCLSERKVLRIPTYAFHDGFSSYKHLLAGVLPISLKPIKADSEEVIKRFYSACVGWVRYKPLLLYITDRQHYTEKINEMKESLNKTLNPICKYFDTDMFLNVIKELNKYDKNVEKHYDDFIKNQKAWAKIMKSLE